MKARASAPKLILFAASAFLLLACLLPGMIPLTPVPAVPAPAFEENSDRVIEVLTGGNWLALQALAEEQYTEEDYAAPGTLTYTITLTETSPIYFSYGWCTVDEETLRQNFQHINVKLYLNGDELGSDVVHSLSYTSPDSLVCLDFGVLITEWPAGKYELEAIATFDQTINDGLADYASGDYRFVYNVTVE